MKKSRWHRTTTKLTQQKFADDSDETSACTAPGRCSTPPRNVQSPSPVPRRGLARACENFSNAAPCERERTRGLGRGGPHKNLLPTHRQQQEQPHTAHSSVAAPDAASRSRSPAPMLKATPGRNGYRQGSCKSSKAMARASMFTRCRCCCHLERCGCHAPEA